MSRKPENEDGRPLRSGWTTGACATAATRAAYEALVTGHFPDPVTITLPRGQTVSFALDREESGPDSALAAIVKDAGDDPDVTHGAVIISTVRQGTPGSGVTFHAGPGVGSVTREGLPVPPGEPAINPVPRRMMEETIAEARSLLGGPADVMITISVPGGMSLAEKTWNPRLGIVGGISILGTTGIVTPFSCSAWIHSIHRGIDVARAANLPHIAAATGSTSEAAIASTFSLPDHALIDMGDFAGGMLKYLRNHPLPRLSIAGGFGKLTKLAEGHMDLHSGRSQVSFDWLADQFQTCGAPSDLIERVRNANTAMEALSLAEQNEIDIANRIADLARDSAIEILGGADISVDVHVFDRQGRQVGKAE